jgi:hypothetical protein
MMGAVILKWIKQRSITIVPARKGIFSVKDDGYAVQFGGFVKAENHYEQGLLDMMRAAAGNRAALKPKQFGKWCKKNHVRVRGFFYRALSSAEEWLKSNGWVTEQEVEERRPGLLSSRTWKRKIQDVDPGLRNEALKLLGLKRFLSEFSLIREKTVFEVRLWEDYLIFAQLLGIAKKVREQLSKVYPDYKVYSNLDARIGAGTAVDFCTGIAAVGCAAAVRGERSAARRASMFDGGGSSSGGGGSSSSGGGGGASGSSSSGSGVR